MSQKFRKIFSLCQPLTNQFEISASELCSLPLDSILHMAMSHTEIGKIGGTADQLSNYDNDRLASTI